MEKLTIIRSRYNPNKTHEEFLAERKIGIGGSDVHNLFADSPDEGYSCARRLIFDKLGMLPEDDRKNHHIERGKFLEAPVAELYGERTNRPTKRAGTGYIKEFPFIRANADRLQLRAEGEPGDDSWGVLEIKCPGEWSFKKIKKEGPPRHYIQQLQYQMLCYGATWGTLAIYWADGHELMHIDYERDYALTTLMENRAKQFWSHLRDSKDDTPEFVVEKYFGRREHDAVCQGCPMEETCWGPGVPHGDGVFELNDEAVIWAIRYNAECKAAKDAEAAKASTKQKMLEAMRAVMIPEDFGKAVDRSGDIIVTARTQTRTTISQDVKEVLTKEQLAQYTKQTTFDVITVKLKDGK